MKLSGEIQLDPAAPALSGATVHIVVQNTTRADARAQEHARLDLEAVVLSPGDPPLFFVLDVPGLDPNERYEVRVHVDVSGDARVAPGDQVSVESLPVLTQGAPDVVTVNLRQVG